jgi:hypothetical protein
MSSALQPNQLIYPIVGQSIPIVYDAYDKWSSLALQAFASAQQLATELTNIPLSPVAFNAHFNPQLALTGITLPPAPSSPGDLVFHEPSLPPPPPVTTIALLPPQAYVSALMDQMKTVIGLLLGGGNLIPDAVARQLRDRAYTEAYVEELRAVDNAYDEYAARGFMSPGGLLNKNVAQARADARAKRQQASRDVFIQEQTVAIENLRFAVTSGIQLEQEAVATYVAQVTAQVEYAKLAVQQNQLQLDGWRAQVEQFNAQLQAEVARLDSQLKIFQSEVQVYTAQVQGASVVSDVATRQFQLNLAQEQAIVQTEMKRQDQQFEQMRYISTIMVEIKRALAEVQSRLASAAMSAVNIGATLSSSSSESLDYNLSLSYSGNLAEG